MTPWWRVSCVSLRCRWTSTRQAETRETAARWGCPRCGRPVVAAPGRRPGLQTITFRSDGT